MVSHFSRVGEKPYQKAFANKVVTNQKLDCTRDLETVYFSRKFQPIRCYKCAFDLTNEPEILEKITMKKKSFSVVYPTCSQCGDFKSSHPKKKVGKRPASFFKPKAKRSRT